HPRTRQGSQRNAETPHFLSTIVLDWATARNSHRRPHRAGNRILAGSSGQHGALRYLTTVEGTTLARAPITVPRPVGLPPSRAISLNFTPPWRSARAACSEITNTRFGRAIPALCRTRMDQALALDRAAT